MQSWASIGRHGLKFYTVQPLLRPAVRCTFATTPVLHRSKRKLKPAKNDEDPEPSGRPDNVSKKLSTPSSKPSSKRNAGSKAVMPDFTVVVASILHEFRQKLGPTHPLRAGWDKFERYILNACKLEDKPSGRSPGPLKQVKTTLQKAYVNAGMAGLRGELEYMLRAEDITARYSTPNLEQQQKVADLRYPAEWYPQARAMQRTIHLHVGPTNSGKTYHALKRLQESKNGFYAGPLRLLAQEVYHRFTASGISCSLVMGDDVKIPEDETPSIVSNTVEMVNLGQQYEVGVIDEIQMIADPKRGWAWTRAVLGSRASELHLCGETRAVPLIRELAALTGDKIEIHRYDRLNPLKVMDQSMRGDLSNLQKGDCLVAFSRLGIHALKADIEKVTGRRAAIVYGGLPAEIRTQQANLFNDPDNDYDFLVASDAIGMGLNLSCKRIIFETLVKKTPAGLVRLSVPEIKQIAGRAGRYRPASQAQSKGKDEEPNIGLVTSLEEVDLPYINQAMRVEPPPLPAAGIFPPEPVFHKFSPYFPSSIPFEYIIKRLLNVSQVHPLFFMCDPISQVENSAIIDTVTNLSIEDRLTFMAAPLEVRDSDGQDVACAFADCVAEHSSGRLLDIPCLNLEVLEMPVSGRKVYLHDLENLHKAIILYSWLSFRFGGVFTDRTLAAHVKELVEARMIRALTEFSSNKKLRKDASLRRQIALQKQTMERERLMADANLDSDSFVEEEPDEETLVDLSADENSTEEQQPITHGTQA